MVNLTSYFISVHSFSSENCSHSFQKAVADSKQMNKDNNKDGTDRSVW